LIDEKLIEFATEKDKQYIEAIKLYGNANQAAKVLGKSPGTIGNAMANLERRAARNGYSPDHGMTKPVPDGFNAARISTNYDKDGKINQQWVIATPDKERQHELMQAAITAMAADLPKVEPVPAPTQTIDELCNLITFSDYHLGMLSWRKEGGADWDLKIAEKMLLDSFLYMVEAAPKAKTLVLCLQGDFLHTDGLLPLTPAHKNVLDADGRYSKIIDVAIRVVKQIIRHALGRHQFVHVVICEGNHDETGSIWMRKMFASMYEDEPRLTVNDSELPFYVYQHGNTMLGFHHGHKVKNEQLPLLFASQYPKMWGNTTKRYCHTGHRHHVDEKEFAGMTVVQHPTLAARDAHAARGGWISERAASVITYHSDFGQVARNVVTPEMLAA